MCVFNMNTALQQSKDYSVAGQYLYKSIKEAIANNDRLSVDMDGVTLLTLSLPERVVGQNHRRGGKRQTKTIRWLC